MTVQATNAFSGPYTGNAATTVFPFSFAAASPAEIDVVVDGVSQGAGFTVVLNADNESGSVTFDVAPAIGALVLLVSDPSFEQETSFKDAGQFLPSTHDQALDRAAIRDIHLKDGLGRSIRAPAGEPLIELPSDRAGKFLSFDASKQPIASSGTGADGALRNDLAVSTGAALIGTSDGGTLAGVVLRPRRLSYGPRAPIRSIRAARTALATLHTEIVGYAAHPNNASAGITGGFGKTEYYVDKPYWDISIPNCIGWAIDQAKTNGGGLIYFDPRGQFDIIVTDDTTFRLNDGNDNFTIYAPGRNVTFWTTALSGTFIVKGANILIDGITFRTLAGPMSGDFTGSGVKDEQILVTVFPQYADKVAFNHCEFRHASDGALDMASTGFTGASAEFNCTVQNSIFWDTDEVSLVGSISDTSTVTDARKAFVTHYNNVFAYCGQRQVKALGLAMVHMVNCYTLTGPWYRDQPSPVASPGACNGFEVQDGGWGLSEGCLWAATNGSGYNATYLVANPTSGQTGKINVTDCAAENSMVFNVAGTVTAPTYTLAHTPVPAAGPLRDAWIADRWAAAGARPDAAPEGLFVWTNDTTAYPNGETVLVERGRTGRWLRIDARTEFPPTPTDGDTSDSTFATSRSYTRAVGFTEGKITSAAIGATSLDMIGLDSSFMAIQGNAAPATLKFLLNTGSLAFADGLHLYLRASSSLTVTLKAATTQTVTVADTTLNTITATAHGMTTGDFPVSVTTSGTMPGGTTSALQYYAIRVDNDTLKFAMTFADALAGTAVDITSAGTGTHTATIGNLNTPNSADIVLNSSSKILHLVYDTGTQRFGVASRPQIQMADVSDLPALANGTFTATLTAVANCSALSVVKGQYSRNGSIVTGSVIFTGTQTTGSTLTKIGISIPVASNLTITGDLLGQCVTSSVTPISGLCVGDATNDRGEAWFICSATGGAAFTLIVNFQYEVK